VVAVVAAFTEDSGETGGWTDSWLVFGEEVGASVPTEFFWSSEAVFSGAAMALLRSPQSIRISNVPVFVPSSLLLPELAFIDFVFDKFLIKSPI
jgi:hypothetical protein